MNENPKGATAFPPADMFAIYLQDKGTYLNFENGRHLPRFHVTF